VGRGVSQSIEDYIDTITYLPIDDVLDGIAIECGQPVVILPEGGTPPAIPLLTVLNGDQPIEIIQIGTTATGFVVMFAKQEPRPPEFRLQYLSGGAYQFCLIDGTPFPSFNADVSTAVE
jgi:hypothetical protein